jgi:hypothetical protein
MESKYGSNLEMTMGNVSINSRPHERGESPNQKLARERDEKYRKTVVEPYLNP